MKGIRLLVCLSLIASLSCKNNRENNQDDNSRKDNPGSKKVQVQGHRGDRGNLPENSIPAFLSAVEKGADVLELDVVVSQDKKIVVSHEPVMLALYMLTPDGDSIAKENEKNYNLYKMDYDSIRKFDSGSKKNRLFPNQQPQKTYKPLLSEVIDTVENYIQVNDLDEVKYNIEIKSSEKNYGIFQPEPADFVDLVMNIIEEKGIKNKVNLQSFDVNILQILNEKYPDIEVAYLVSKESINKNLEKLGFIPDIYSPNYKLLKNKEVVDSIKERNMDLIPWTVNEEEAINKMLELKVDGIITDYPERVLNKI
ncbi:MULTISPECIES: glycerophosphodiester phosphodiesterase family protein [Salegentibacter]|jgi:glycerophosphoryl diester phosphodiesterase|uniref:Glycerophosphoryl diester phosphodiesterase n=1 Tax=Salegentibacter agarivorans TaxID=345907 RepID=A0A1I2LZ87_9FLAO|nr:MULTISPECIES: glycerophosphodiester phosphodiesterase family protein [Salegentibacter]APS37775.1 glycerophosphodiester phosphodiesterase [Salegentibacter sp. T436]SFF82647.1 glycerophosphoryl diester phosphodiesterase [Salegentibacter agarivorans]